MICAVSGAFAASTTDDLKSKRREIHFAAKSCWFITLVSFSIYNSPLKARSRMTGFISAFQDKENDSSGFLAKSCNPKVSAGLILAIPECDTGPELRSRYPYHRPPKPGQPEHDRCLRLT